MARQVQLRPAELTPTTAPCTVDANLLSIAQTGVHQAGLDRCISSVLPLERLMLGLLAHKAAEDEAELCLSPLNAKAVTLLAVAAGAPHARPHRRHHAADDRQQHHELREPTRLTYVTMGICALEGGWMSDAVPGPKSALSRPGRRQSQYTGGDELQALSVAPVDDMLPALLDR